MDLIRERFRPELAVRPGVVDMIRPRPRIPLEPLPFDPGAVRPVPPPGLPPPPAPPVTPPSPPIPLPPAPVGEPTLTAPPAGNPFADLPMPAPGDRIRADDFKNLSQALRILYDASALSAALYGRTLGEARVALAARDYLIESVLTTGGAAPGGPGDPAFDGRRVLAVMPVVLGERRVNLLIGEVVEARRYMPDLVGSRATYTQATQLVRDRLGDVPSSGAPMTVPDLRNRSMTEAWTTLVGGPPPARR